MLGFIKKDIAMIKSNKITLLILIFIYVLMGLSNQIDMSFILPFTSVVVMLSTFSYDTYNKWDAYSITLPDGRKNNIKGKYLATLLILFIISVIILILSFIISYVNAKTMNYEQNFITMLGTIFGTLLVLDVMYPIIYKFGIEKARILIFAIVIVLVMGISIIANYLDFSNILNKITFIFNYWYISIPLLSIIPLYLSYKISLHIYRHKEF